MPGLATRRASGIDFTIAVVRGRQSHADSLAMQHCTDPGHTITGHDFPVGIHVCVADHIDPYGNL